VTPAAAADLGRDALIWLASRPEALGRFLASSGAGPAEIRARAADPEFLGFVLDFLLSDEALLRDFATGLGLDPTAPARARAALPGGDVIHWT
jgi:hypothetical protein